MTEIQFWVRVKTLIKAHNLTQKQFAEKLGFSQHTVRGWIYHNRVPELSAAYTIVYAQAALARRIQTISLRSTTEGSHTLGVSLEYLLGGKDRKITELRLRELELRKAAGRILKNMDKMQKELKRMRPIAEWRR